jgi:hypothetical protein
MYVLNKLAQGVMLLTYILEVPGSLAEVSVVFLVPPSPACVGILPQN